MHNHQCSQVRFEARLKEELVENKDKAQEEIYNLNSPISIKEIEIIVFFKLSRRENSGHR